MCSTQQVISPSGALFKHRKTVDPLGLTKTAVGDPTGRIRKTTASIEKAEAAAQKAKDDAANVYPNALRDAAGAADDSTAMTIRDRLRRRSAFATSLVGANYSNAYPSLLSSTRT